MKSIRECREDQRTLRRFDERLAALIKDASTEAGSLRSRSLERDDEDLAVAYELTTALVEQLKKSRSHTEMRGQLSHHFQSRLVTLKARRPSLLQRIFFRRQLKEARA